VTRTAPLLVAETPAHAQAVERVLDRGFGPGRFAKPSERVREFAPHLPALSRVALMGADLVGVCRIYDIAIGGRPALFLGPLAVDPDAQHGGLGHALVAATIDACRAINREAIVLMGEPSFFGALGFEQIPPGQVLMPGPVEARRLQWIALRTGAFANLAGPISRPRAASPA
jgi:predicted N-acetyltransferase YhbS